MRPEIVAGLDIMIVRELTGDIYFGSRAAGDNAARRKREGFDTMLYSTVRDRRIARVGFEIARKRGDTAVLGRQGQRAGHVEMWREK